jgi:hypothetical protein
MAQEGFINSTPVLKQLYTYSRHSAQVSDFVAGCAPAVECSLPGYPRKIGSAAALFNDAGFE